RQGHADVRYPVFIHRMAHWDGVRPHGTEPFAIWLPPDGFLGTDDLYVPAGLFRSGGDPTAFAGHPLRHLWVDPFVVKRFPVTNAQYIGFLDDLVRQGREDEALRHAPRERASREGDLGSLLYDR